VDARGVASIRPGGQYQPLCGYSVLCLKTACG
jgi:hypothetical protein